MAAVIDGLSVGTSDTSRKDTLHTKMETRAAAAEGPAIADMLAEELQ